MATVRSGSMNVLLIVWLRRDLRLSDQPAIVEAAGKGPVTRRKGYPAKIVEHRDGREQALTAWQKTKTNN